jgi:hypothetical protein
MRCDRVSAVVLRALNTPHDKMPFRIYTMSCLSQNLSDDVVTCETLCKDIYQSLLSKILRVVLPLQCSSC